MRSKKFSVSLILFSAALAPAIAATPDWFGMSDEQMRHSGIAIERIAPSSAQGGAEDGLRLPGSAVFPGKAIQVISAPAAGVVQAVLTEPMDKVAAGMPIMRLHSPQLLEWQRSYVQLSLQAQLASNKHRRDEALFKEGIIPEGRLQETRSAYEQSRVAEQELRQVLAIAGMGDGAIRRLAGASALSPILNVTVPAAGIVIEQMVSPGQRVEAGAPLTKVARQGSLWIELQAARPQVERIDVGDAVTVSGCPQAGRITAVGAQMGGATQTVLVRAELPSAHTCLRPNQYVEALVKPRRAPAGASAVPASALARLDGKDYVFVREGGGFRPVTVTVESRGAANALVQGALKPGAEVAVRGVSTLKGVLLGLGADGEPQ